MAYSDKVIDHYENPRNVGSFDKGDDSIVRAMSKPPTLLDNSNNAGQNPTNRPTSSNPVRSLFTIGTRGQERGEA